MIFIIYYNYRVCVCTCVIVLYFIEIIIYPVKIWRSIMQFADPARGLYLCSDGTVTICTATVGVSTR